MQRLKRVIRRIAAVGTGVAMLGASMTGALAQSGGAALDNYPDMFFKNGVLSDNTAFVVGRNAAADDVIGLTNVAKQMQADSKVCVPGGAGGSSVSVSGDAVEITTTSDLLELNETLGDVRETITEVELDGLKGGIVTTNSGTTEFNQYLRFKELNATSNTLTFAPAVLFKDNDAPVKEVGDWLVVKEGAGAPQAFFEYELEFEDGLESDIVSNKLDDLRDEELVILGTTYTVVDTKVNTGSSSVKLEMLGGAEYAIMEEGETRTFTIDGREYEVEILIIEDTSPATVTLKINGEVTDQLLDGETEILRDGTLIGVSDIVLNEAGEAGSGDIVELYIGATKVEFNDNNYGDGESSADLGFNNNVKIDEETIEDAWVQVKANLLSDNTELEIFSIKYRLDADALPGSRDIYVPPGHGVREYLDEPQGMLGLNWDVKYEGLDDVGVSLVKLDPAGDDEYNLEFENNQGLVYKFPYISNENGIFKFGDDNDDLVMIEGNHTQNGAAGNLNPQQGIINGNISFNIGLLDYFVLTDSAETLDDTATTHVIRYNSLDTSQRQLQFDDEATGSKKFIYETTNLVGTIGKAEIVFGGNTYVTFIANASGSGSTGGNDNPLVIDQNKDGRIERDKLRLTLNGGGVLDPMAMIGGLNVVGAISGGFVASAGNFTAHLSDGGVITSLEGALGTGGTWSNTGIRISNVTGGYGTNVTMTLTTLSEDFDENLPARLQGQNLSPTNEFTNWTITTRANNRLGITSSTFNSNGGLVLIQPDEDDDNFYGMTDYGAYVNLFDPEGTDNAETLTIEYPLKQRGARVFVVMGDTSVKKTSVGELCTVADIDLQTMFDDEITDPTMYNLIFVGGPCINSAVEKIDDFPTCADWPSKYGPGDAIIQLAGNGENYALLVAGTDARDTRRAAKAVESKSGLTGTLAQV